MWEHVADGPARDRAKFRDELLWQEYARHLYARLGRRMGEHLRHEPPAAGRWPEPWPREMACMELTAGQLEQEGWLVNQQRMWLASQHTVRAGHDWRAGEDAFFAHLLDGGRAANRLGWQWVVGTGSGKPYGFSRWQVRKRAPGLCDTCSLRNDCPIEAWPPAERGPAVAAPDLLRADPDLERTTGPREVARGAGPGVGAGAREPEAVWLTGESLGDADPALAARPGLPAVFVFDEGFLREVRLSGKRLVFLAQVLGDLATRRRVEIHRGDPVRVLRGRAVAVTHAPVPGFRRRARLIGPAETHPWPWLVTPHAGQMRSFSAWRKQLRL